MSKHFGFSELISNESGFSLIEVAIAVGILAIGILATATVQSTGIRGNDLGNRTTQAIALAQDKLEELINTSRTAALAVGTTNDPNNDVDETGAAGGIFTRSWTVQDDTPYPDAQNIIVSVAWNDIVGQHRVTVNGIITDDGY